MQLIIQDYQTGYILINFSSPINSILNYAISTLHELLLHQEESIPAVRSVGGLHVMVPLLRKDNALFLSIVVDSIRLLAYRHQESKDIILRCNGTIELLRIMGSYTSTNLLWMNARLLKGNYSMFHTLTLIIGNLIF